MWKNRKWKLKKSPWSKDEYQYKRDPMNNNLTVKIVVVGDGAVGKTSLLNRYVNKVFEYDYVPTVFDNYSTKAIYKNELYTVSLWDTAGAEDYDKLRPLSYVGTDLFLLCFDIGNSNSLINASERWLKELTDYASNVPILLCGTKLDLRRSSKYLESFKSSSSSFFDKFVTFDQGVQIAKKIGAIAYAETSSKDGDGVEDVFTQVMKYACEFFKFQRERKNDNCKFM